MSAAVSDIVTSVWTLGSAVLLGVLVGHLWHITHLR